MAAIATSARRQNGTKVVRVVLGYGALRAAARVICVKKLGCIAGEARRILALGAMT